jgi:hypothetical protein
MVTALWWMCAPALAGGFSVASTYTSSYGPDAYGTVQLQAEASPDIEIGALVIGGVRQAWLATAARRLRLSDGIGVRAELDVGLRRRTVEDVEEVIYTAYWAPEPTLLERIDLDAVAIGGQLGLDVDAGPVVAIADVGWLLGFGWRVEGGVDAPVAPHWKLAPRVRVETWAGDRDPALRAEAGVRWDVDGGFWMAAAASAGGRDVFHMGPGVALTLARSR